MQLRAAGRPDQQRLRVAYKDGSPRAADYVDAVVDAVSGRVDTQPTSIELQ